MTELKNLTGYKLSLQDRITEQACQLFTTHGIKAVTMDDVARQLAISKRTLYEIFGTKEALLLAIIVDYRKKHGELLREKLAGCSDVMDILLVVYRDKIEEFRHVNPLFYSELSHYPQLLQGLQSDREEQRRQFLKFMERGISEGYFRQDINYTLVEQLFNELGRYLMKSELYRHHDIEDLFRNVIFVTLRGLCTTKGVQRLDQFLTA